MVVVSDEAEDVAMALVVEAATVMVLISIL
jgi:hypothetical protein